LHIEGSLDNLALVETIVQRWPRTRTIAAMQGRLGLALAQHHVLAMILLDLQLPDLSGRAVLRLLQTDHQTRRIPVITFGTRDTAALDQSLAEAGVRAHLTKPLPVGRLIELFTPALAQVHQCG